MCPHSRYRQAYYIHQLYRDYRVLCSSTTHLNPLSKENEMNTENINWDEVPDTLSLEQIRKLIHVSKRVAKTLLDTEIPCIHKARTTHKYYVDKQDLIDYLGTHSGTHYQISNTKNEATIHDFLHQIFQSFSREEWPSISDRNSQIIQS